MSDSTPTDYSLLIPELARWNNGDGIDVDGWLDCTGTFNWQSHSAAYSGPNSLSMMAAFFSPGFRWTRTTVF